MQRNLVFMTYMGIALAVPVLAMVIMPLADTSEPRYAEIARLMYESGDWITPWFAPGTPFWGKPPLSFWLQAASMHVFGLSEFAVRLPSWIAGIVTLWLLYRCTVSLFNTATARRAVLIYATCALSLVSSGAVLTDPFLALGTTLCMSGWIMAGNATGLFWRYSFFIGLAVGLLAKGPLILVLVGGAIGLWLLFYPQARKTPGFLPWRKGLALTLLLSTPWYLAAELKTPGFLNYFFIGEHFLRFIDPGWNGDLYGTAHKANFGTIWYYWLQASFPWGFAALPILLTRLFSSRQKAAMRRYLSDAQLGYFLAWSLFTPLFFTFSGNILWTYILPSLGGFSICLAYAWTLPANDKNTNPKPKHRWHAVGFPLLTLFAPAAITALVVTVSFTPNLLKTEKLLVQHTRKVTASDYPLYYLDEVPFSARFYSFESAQPLKEHEISAKIRSGRQFWLAVPKNRPSTILKALNQPEFSSKRYSLYLVNKHAQNALTAQATQSGLIEPISQ
ncbi:MAG TPA: hypothetical protein DEB15_09815 [Pusillimonas sp.]|jgi:4-amino-4-deoxy-L-arabinose transferase-like glycosyltransferase|nr:hypothetical protein [Pusillimonas sp.]|tara:strand:+ start:70927 stop:72438 length:1512 start_codon:yes stop_codon:yes gene_type:complete